MTIGALPEDLKDEMDYFKGMISSYHNLAWIPHTWSWYLTYLLRLESLARQIPEGE